MSSLFKILAICLVFLSLSYAQKHKNQEICHFVGDSFTDDSSIELTTVKTTIIQDSCVEYFSLDLSNPEFTDKYVDVEIYFTNAPHTLKFAPVFLQKMDTKPVLYFNSASHTKIQEDADIYDANGYLNRKSYHHIVLNPIDTHQGGISYFALYKAYRNREDYFDSEITYDIQVKISETYPCPQDCSGNGVCDVQKQKCICNEGFFDVDCSVQAISLTLDQSQHQSVESNRWQYFYHHIGNVGDISILTEKSNGLVEFSFTVGNPENIFLPNFYVSHGNFPLPPQENNYNLSIIRTLPNKDNKEILLIGVYNFENEPVTVRVQIQPLEEVNDSVSTILYVFVGVFLGLIVFWSSLLLVKYRIDRQHGIWGGLEYALPTKTEALLSKEEVENYFPTKKFEDLKSPYPQTLCSICLEDFQDSSECRQLYCEHIYHNHCIEAWVIKHDNCPNCKKKMTKKAIEEFNTSKDAEKSTNGEYTALSIRQTIPNLRVLTNQQPDNEQQCLLDCSDKSPEYNCSSIPESPVTFGTIGGLNKELEMQNLL